MDSASWQLLEQESAEAELINTKICILIAQLESSKAVVLRLSIDPFTSSVAVAEQANGYHELALRRDTGPFHDQECYAAEPVLAVYDTLPETRSDLRAVDLDGAASITNTADQVDLGDRAAHRSAPAQRPSRIAVPSAVFQSVPYTEDSFHCPVKTFTTTCNKFDGTTFGSSPSNPEASQPTGLKYRSPTISQEESDVARSERIASPKNLERP